MFEASYFSSFTEHDKEKVISLTVKRSPKERQYIMSAYKQSYGKVRNIFCKNAALSTDCFTLNFARFRISSIRSSLKICVNVHCFLSKFNFSFVVKVFGRSSI